MPLVSGNRYRPECGGHQNLMHFAHTINYENDKMAAPLTNQNTWSTLILSDYALSNDHLGWCP